MARGPLPHATTRRRNAPTIATTKLPESGRKGRAPSVPASYKLGKAGKAWWAWAWKLPQACAWDKGAHYAIARRAQLEDDLDALQQVDALDIEGLLGGENIEDAARDLEFLLRRMAAMTRGSVTVMKECRELDKRLGIDPKALAELRWAIVPDDEVDEDDGGAKKSSKKKAKRKPAAKKRPAAVDPEAAAE